MRRQYAILWLMIAFPFVGMAQDAVIKGKSVGDIPPQGKVTLYQYTDYLTENLYERAVAEVKDNSFQFVLKYHDHTEPFMLSYKGKTTKVFVEPGGEYEVWLGQQGFVLVKEPDGGLNKKIMDHGNTMFNFLQAAKGADAISPTAFDDFKLQQYMKHYNEKNDFFNAYYKYDLKIKELFFGATGQYPMNVDAFNKAERDYLTETKIRLRHPKWGEYFKTHVEYRNRFCQLQRIPCCDPQDSCQQTAAYEEARLFKNDTLRELALVEAIAHKIEANKGGDKIDEIQQLNLLLDSLELEASTNPAKDIVKQYKERYDLFGLGSQMPTVTLENMSGNMVRVNEFEGKYVLLDFWALWCRPCLKEMNFLSNLPDRMPDKLALVSISVDESKENAWKFVRDKGYDWLFLYNGEDRLLLNQLLINVYPAYFLFDPNGKLIYRPSSLSAEWSKIEELVKGE